jgi:predicted TIM-barrel fold metal-dependent hydrolase
MRKARIATPPNVVPPKVVTPEGRNLHDETEAMNIQDLIAIDTHVHIEAEEQGEAGEAARKYFGNAGVGYGRKELADYYRSRKIGCVVFSVDERITGRPQVPNDEVAAFAAENSDIVMAFASVDPTRGAAAVAEAKRLIGTGGIRGFKLHPPLQQVHANDKIAYPFYEVLNEAKMPVVFHTGHSGIGTGMPGGGGIRLKYGNPMDIDDVAVDFPDMPIILAHPSFPWQDEAISVCLHKPQVHIDLSGWSPKYFPANLIQYANTLLKRKVLFGSDYPLITPDRWMTDFAAIGIKDEVRPLILKENAVRLFDLAER